MKKALYGILAFLPIVEIIISAIALVASFIMLGGLLITGAYVNADLAMILLWVGIIGIIVGIVICIADAIIFCAHVKKNENLEDSSRPAWITSLITLMFLAFPVYWWKCIK